MTHDLASTTEWLSTVASLASALAAVAALLVAVRATRSADRSAEAAQDGVAVARSSLEQQLTAAHHEAERVRRAQAQRVSAWARRRQDDGRPIVAHNGSEDPIFDVRLWLVTADEAHEDSVAPPSTEPTAKRFVLPPSEDFVWSVSVSGAAPAVRPSVVIAFRDLAGACWWRDAGGRLLPLPTSAAPANGRGSVGAEAPAQHP